MRLPDIIERYPRLIAAMQRVAHLSNREAAHCIACRRAGFNGAGEAVNHHGGNSAVITDAFKTRHRFSNHQSGERL